MENIYYSLKKENQKRELVIRTKKISALRLNEVLIKVKYAALNYRDILIYDEEPSPVNHLEIIPTSDGVGEIVSIGKLVSQFKVGDRVMGTFFQDWVSEKFKESYIASALGEQVGFLSRYVVLNEKGIVQIADELTFEEAVCLPCAAVTAWVAIQKKGQISKGTSVLFLGTGGVSIFGIQIAKALGAQIFVTSRSEEKLKIANGYGANYLINTQKTPDWDKEVLNISNRVGVDLIAETLGGSNIRKSLSALAPEGKIAFIGCLESVTTNFDPNSLLYKNASLFSVYVGSREDLISTQEFIVEHTIKPHVDKIFTFQDAENAFAYLRKFKFL